MKAWCEHHQPWFKCGVCAERQRVAVDDVARAERDVRAFNQRRLAGMSLTPTLSCRIKDA